MRQCGVKPYLALHITAGSLWLIYTTAVGAFTTHQFYLFFSKRNRQMIDHVSSNRELGSSSRIL